MLMPTGAAAAGTALQQLPASMLQSRTATAGINAAKHIPGIGVPLDDQQGMATAAAAASGSRGGIGGMLESRAGMVLSLGPHASPPLISYPIKFILTPTMRAAIGAILLLVALATCQARPPSPKLLGKPPYAIGGSFWN